MKTSTQQIRESINMIEDLSDVALLAAAFMPMALLAFDESGIGEKILAAPGNVIHNIQKAMYSSKIAKEKSAHFKQQSERFAKWLIYQKRKGKVYDFEQFINVFYQKYNLQNGGISIDELRRKWREPLKQIYNQYTTI